MVVNPSILAVRNQDEAPLCFPTRMTRQRTLSNVINIFGSMTLVLSNLRKKNDALKQQQERIWMEQEDEARASGSVCFFPQVPSAYFTLENTNESYDHAVPMRECWIKLGGKRRQCAPCLVLTNKTEQNKKKCRMITTRFTLIIRFVRLVANRKVFQNPEEQGSTSARCAAKNLTEIGDHAVATRACWIKFGGKRRQCVLC